MDGVTGMLYPKVVAKANTDAAGRYRLHLTEGAKIGFAVGVGPAPLGNTSGHSTNVDMEW